MDYDNIACFIKGEIFYEVVGFHQILRIICYRKETRKLGTKSMSVGNFAQIGINNNAVTEGEEGFEAEF